MKSKWMILCIAVITFGLCITIAIKQLTTPHKLTENEMIKQIEQVYNASVQTFVEQNDGYIASFNKGGSIFEVNVNPVTGQYSSLKPIHNHLEQSTSKPTNEETNPPLTSKEDTKPLLSKKQAIQIALNEVPGEIDSVEYEYSSDGGSYFIEIEQEDDITVQVHAITGKILSIQYDD